MDFEIGTKAAAEYLGKSINKYKLNVKNKDSQIALKIITVPYKHTIHNNTQLLEEPPILNGTQ